MKKHIQGTWASGCAETTAEGKFAPGNRLFYADGNAAISEESSGGTKISMMNNLHDGTEDTFMLDSNVVIPRTELAAIILHIVAFPGWEEEKKT